MSADQKFEKLMSPVEAAGLLRALAERLEAGNLEFGHVAVELDDFFSVKQSVKTKSDRVCFKLRLKYEKSLYPLGTAAPVSTHPALEKDLDDDEEEGEAREGGGYKQLKKSMSRHFKEIGKALELGALPDAALAERFHAQCLAMTGFPGKGDERYQEFKVQADLLLTAVGGGDLSGAGQAAAALGDMKKTCHSRHK